MNIRLAVNLSKLISEKEKMEINGRLPEFVAKTLSVDLLLQQINTATAGCSMPGGAVLREIDRAFS